MSLSKINNLLLSRLKETHNCDQIEIYHFRSFLGDNSNFMSYKDISVLKEKTPNLTNLLDGGFTVILTRESESPESAICSISYCNEADNFNKAQGINLCLKRLDNYLSKPEKDSWKYNENNFFHLTNLPTEREKLVDIVSRHLNRNYKHFAQRGIKVYNTSA